MKVARLIAVFAALMLVATGCTSRNNQNDPNPGSVPDLASAIEDGIDEAESMIEEEASKVEDALDMSGEDGEYSDDDGILNEDDDSRDDTDRDDDLNEEESIAAMSTDFTEIGALDAAMDNGFPGGPVDDMNRPSGPIAYQQKYGGYGAHFIVPGSKKIYLTFDEGYENGYTAQILDVLKEKNVKAVFFLTYPYAETEKELVRRMVDEGHTLGNHSTAHKNFTTMALEDAAADIQKLHDYVKAQYGYEMFLFRPPEGAFSEQTLALAQSLGYKTVLWSFAYKDYDVDNQPLTLEATDRIVSRAHPGEICLLHAVSKTNAEILGDVIDQLRAQDYEFADYFHFY